MSNLLKTILVVAVVTVLALVAYDQWSKSDQRDMGERLSDAAESLSEGVDNAGDQLRDHTPLERMGDKLDNAVDRNLKDH